MARVSVTDRTRLSLLLVRRGVRTVAGRLYGHPLIRLPGKAERLVIAPQDLRTADATRASEIYAARFAFAGKVVICDGRSPFEMIPPSDEWAAALLGFGWLRHLRAADTNINRANARSLVDEWIAQQGSWNAIAWRPEILARRVISWLSHAPLVLQETDVRFYRRFLRSLTRQIRYLRVTAADTSDGVPRLHAVIALTYATLCMANQTKHMRGMVKRLSQELDRQVLPDGGHISRNPGALIELLLDMLPLRQAFAARNVSPPISLLNAIDRMMPMLRFFRHGDGSFAHFNGMGPSSPDLTATVLAYDDVRGTPLAHAPHSGYQRVDAADAVLIVDTGRPPPLLLSQEAHAGTLSFEFSAKQQQIVVNCGLPNTSRENWRTMGRATPAHSTMVFAETSSCQFLESELFKGFLCGAPIVSGPAKVTSEREEHGSSGVILRASHDGYAGQFGVIHQRAFMLSAGGHRLDGEDMLAPARGNAFPRKTNDTFAIRFHLHPTVKANRLSDGQSVVLMLPNRDVWNFNAHDDKVELEESVYLAGSDGPRRTVQIVIHARLRDVELVRWTLSRSTAAPPPRRARAEEPQLPL